MLAFDTELSYQLDWVTNSIGLKKLIYQLSYQLQY